MFESKNEEWRAKEEVEREGEKGAGGEGEEKEKRRVRKSNHVRKEERCLEEHY